MSGRLIAAMGIASLVIASWALAAEEMTPPKSDLPTSPERVERMRFVPGTLNCTPSPMWAHLAFGFRLDEPAAAPPK